jgi:uncharacterized repeat protein (TIGR02543 family)
METFKTYISDINKCLQEIINIFSLQEVVVHFDLLDDKNAIDNHDLDDKSESLPDLIVYKDQSIGDLPTPKARKYYDFKGWFLNFERDDYYTPPEVYWSNEVEDYSKVVAPGNLITLYAKWELKTIDIKLDPCGGTVFPETIPVKYYETFEKELSKVQIAKKNSKFTEWISNTNETISGASKLEPGITSLFAQYITPPCTLKFDYSYKIKGVISDPKKSILCANISALSNLQIGDSFNLAEDISGKNFIQDTTLTANGYVFKGWSKLKNNPDVIFTVYLYEDTTLYAYWEPISYTINYKYRNIDSDTPIYRQKLMYGQAAPLIPYKTIFNEDAPSNFEWKKTSNITYTSIILNDNELVENLLSTDNSTVTLYRPDGIPKINANLYGVENTKNGYIEGEKFNGIDFNLYFNNGLILHPSKISPSYFSKSNNLVTCFYGNNNFSIECRVNADTSNNVSFVSAEIYGLDEMRDKYEYGKRLNFYGVFARETYSDGSKKDVYFDSYPDNFITYPVSQTILKKSFDLYFGYKSITDGSIWPHVDDNKAMWDCTEISKHIEVSSGEKNIAITSLPRKLNYIEGEKLSLDGIKLMLEMTTLERFPLELSSCTVDPDTLTKLTPSDTTITIYLTTNENISATYNISIIPKEVIAFKFNFPADYSFIVPSNISNVSSIDMSNVSVEVSYDSRTTTTYLYSDFSDQLSLVCNNLSSRYGEIDVNAYFKPPLNNPDNKIFNTKFTLKKQFPSFLFSFITDSEENMYIHTLSCKNENFEISLECYKNVNTPIIEEIFFTTNGSFSDSINIPETYTYFIVRGTHFVSDISNITQYNNYVTFNSEIIRRSPEINFINQNISVISKFVPPYTFYQSNLSSILLHNDSVEFIDDYGFYNDVNLTSINFPTSLTYIGQNAFSNCENILSMRFNSKNPPEILENSFGSTPSDYTGNGISEPTISVYTKSNVLLKTVERLIRYKTSSYISVEIGQTNNFTALSSRPSYSYYLIDNDNFK